jgi:phytanoyl-CoA hydroxylase
MFSQQEIEQYHRQGYCIYRSFLGAEDLASLRGELDAACEGATLSSHDRTRIEMEPHQDPGGTLVRRVYEPCTHYDRFRALSDSDRLLDCVEQLLGPNLCFHYSKINVKPPSIGSVVEWHQDLAYYPLTNGDSVSILFYLDDADGSNGCLQVIPGRHLGPRLDHDHDGYFQGRVTTKIDESAAVALDGKAGDVIFMHCMTPHASTTNKSLRFRRTLILSYRATDAFPIHVGETTLAAERFVRLVRGRQLRVARFSMKEFPIPVYRTRPASLYELQEQSRKEMTKAT